MRRPALPRAAHYPLLALAVLAAAGPARVAFITQTVFVGHDRNGSQTASDSDVATGTEPADLRDIAAAVAGPTYTAAAGAGRFGDVGLSTGLIVSFSAGFQETTAEAVIRAVNVVTNTGPRPLRVTSRFIIDGGELEFVGDDAPYAEYTLTVRSSALGLVGEPASIAFFSSGRLAAGAAGIEFTAAGEDIGAVPDLGPVLGTVRIPLSFQTADLGVLDPGESLGLLYVLRLNLGMGSRGEIVTARFSDPLSLSGNPALGALTLTPVPGAAVPEPSALALAGLGVAGLLGRLRRPRA